MGLGQVLVNGVDWTSHAQHAGGVIIRRPLNDAATATLVLKPGYVPAKFTPVHIYDGATLLFGGIVRRRSIMPVVSRRGAFWTRIECLDFFIYLDWTFVSLTYAAPVTLKTVLTDIVAQLPGSYGMSLDAGQATGPTLDPFTWTNMKTSDGLRELSTRSGGYVARFSPLGALKMLLPGTESAPYAITDAAPHFMELTWTDGDLVPATKVILLVGPAAPANVTQTWTASGAETSWTTDWPATNVDPVGLATVKMPGDPIYYSVPISKSGEGGAMEWDRATHVLDIGPGYFLTSPPPAGTTIQMTYTAAFPATVTATTGGTPEVQVLARREDLMELGPAQEYADGLLSQYNQNPRQLAVLTRDGGCQPGQVLSINLTAMSLTADFLLTEVETRLVLKNEWQFVLSGQETDTYQGSYLDRWQNLLGGGGSSGVSVGGGGGGGGTQTVLSSPYPLGGARLQSLHVPTANAWHDVWEHTDYIASADFSGLVRADIWARTAVGVTVRLQCVSGPNSGDTAGTSSQVTSTTPTYVAFYATILAGNTYRLQVTCNTNNGDAYAKGVLYSA